jgi:hypothetical protein
MADHAQRRSEIATEIAQLREQQNDAIQDATFLGNYSLGNNYGERARRVADLLSELALLDEKHSVQAD